MKTVKEYRNFWLASFQASPPADCKQGPLPQLSCARGEPCQVSALRLICFCFYFILATSLVAQPQSSTNVLARAAVDNNQLTIGDQVEMKVNISAPAGTQISEGGWRSSKADGLPESLEIIDARDLNTIAETPELLLEQRFTFQVFDTGYVFIPALAFPFQPVGAGAIDTAFTEPLLLTIRGIPLNDQSELMPIQPIVKEGMNWLDLWPLYLAAFVVIGGFFLWRYLKYRANRKVVPPPPPPKPAHVLALEALTDLEQRQLWQNEQTKEYYSELSRILRQYLEGRFGIPAMESTTKQLTHALRTKTDFDPEQSGELSELLQLSDLVKFARAEPAADLHQRGLERVREFVNNTVPRPPVDPIVGVDPSVDPHTKPDGNEEADPQHPSEAK